ncbi:hypothetical protein PsorP6_013016 [Peronosclerospora sorghi]|uniref:Uncharacterized protein n=1 Tax=Peronosclerospora sorghi TaxID=230839 RepID=A0ACC0WF70_9STRA|nr:hypothetical protein PsorP6_013016 [Peronosclerospora sorghi]
MQIELFHTSHAHTVFFYRPCLSRYQTWRSHSHLGVLWRPVRARGGTLELAALPFLLGSVLVGLAYGEVTVLLGRYFLGAAAGMISVIVPIYLAEVSGAHTRGRVVCPQQFLSALGDMSYVPLSARFLSLCRDSLGLNVSEWRLLAWIDTFPALLLVLLTQKLPDSPTWRLARHNDRDPSFQVLYQLFTPDGRVAEQETNAIIHAQVLAKATARRHHGSEDDVLSVTLTVAGAAATGIVACYYLVDTRGRLVALQCGAYAVAIACAFLLVSISNGTGDTDAFLCDSGWAAILFANAGHQVGLGVVPVILVSELFAVKQRLGAITLVMIWEAIVQVGLTQLLPLVRDVISCRMSLFRLGAGLVMACHLLAIVLSWWYIPETSQRSLQAIEAILSGWQPATPRRSTSSHVRLEYGSNNSTE